jgi:hypothetical protein
MVVETKKILDPKIKVTATCVRVPVFVGHSEAINIEFENEISAEQAQRILREAPGVMLVDKREDGGYVTPVECVGDYATFVSRVREDSTVDNGLSIWVVSDNLPQGRGAERGPDRRAARPQAFAEGGMINVEQANVRWSRSPTGTQLADRPAAVLRELRHLARLPLRRRTTKMDLTVASFDDPSRFRPTIALRRREHPRSLARHRAPAAHPLGRI